jgi:hypothetical protein
MEVSRKVRRRGLAPGALLAAGVLLMMTGCVAIGDATVQLSAEVGYRIAEMEKLHIAAVHRYFDSETAKIERFMAEEWEPLYLENFLALSGVIDDLQGTAGVGYLSQSLIEDALAIYLLDPSEAREAAGKLFDEITEARRGELSAIRGVLEDYIEDDRVEAATAHVQSLMGADDRGQIILEFAAAAHAEMDAQRKELIDPVRTARDLVITEISGAYADLIAAQNLVTARLETARRASKQQDELLEYAGLDTTAEEIRARLAKISSQVDDALQAAQGVVGEDAERARGMIETIKSKLGDLF